MTKFFLKMIICLLFSMQIVNGQVQNNQNYIYLSDVKSNLTSIKIGKSNLNKFIDTNEFFYKICVIPSDYKTQNLKNGKYFQYFLQDTNKIAFELLFKNGNLVSFKSYWFNDSLKQTGQLSNGSNDGKWIGYYPNGIVSEIFLWSQGIHHEFYFYFSDGTLKRHCKELEIGNGKYRLWEIEDYYSNGKLKQNGQTKNGYKINLWTYYNKDGSLKEKKKHKGTEWLETESE